VTTLVHPHRRHVVGLFVDHDFVIVRDVPRRSGGLF
jgi:hypothetical protein